MRQMEVFTKHISRFEIIIFIIAMMAHAMLNLDQQWLLFALKPFGFPGPTVVFSPPNGFGIIGGWPCRTFWHHDAGWPPYFYATLDFTIALCYSSAISVYAARFSTACSTKQLRKAAVLSAFLTLSILVYDPVFFDYPASWLERLLYLFHDVSEAIVWLAALTWVYGFLSTTGDFLKRHSRLKDGQFSLATVLTCSTLLSILFGIVVMEYRANMLQQDAVKHFEENLGYLSYESINSGVRRLPGRLCRDLVNDTGLFVYFYRSLHGWYRINHIDLTSTDASSIDWKYLQSVPFLQEFYLRGAECRNRELLRELSKCRYLEVLSLEGEGLDDDRVDDDDLEHLSPCDNLRVLSLARQLVSDRSIDHLSRFKSLRQLDLSYTNISNSGMQKLKSRLPACDITYEIRGR